MGAVDIAIIAGFIVAYGLVSKVVERSLLTGPMLFVGFGLLMGTEGFDLVDIPIRDEGVELLGEATLGLLLFSDAIRIDIRRLRREYSLPARMLALGLPLAIVVGTAAATVVLEMPFYLAAIVAAILAPTDAALGQTVVTSPEVPVRVRQSLNVESGLNDGLALPAVTVFVALAAEEEGFERPISWVRFAAEQIGYGALVGATVGCVGGWLVARASERSWMEGSYRQIAVLGVAVLAFACADMVDGNGFIATFSAGLGFGTVARKVCPHVEEFTEDVALLLAMASFIIFGAILVEPAVGDLDWRIALYVALSLAVVRPLAVAVSLIGTGLRPPTVLFFGWFGPRGLASILFLLFAVSEGGDLDLDPVFDVVAWTVLVSIVVHGLSGNPGAAAYGRWWRVHGEDHMAEAMPMDEQRTRRDLFRGE